MTTGADFNLYRYGLSTSEINQVQKTAKQQGITEEQALEELFPNVAEETTKSEETLSAEYEEILSKLEAQKTNTSNTTQENQPTTQITNSINTSSLQELNEKREENLAEMEELEEEIEVLADEIEAEITAAIQAQEKAVEQNEEDTEKAVDAELQKYIEANKNGEGMTQEELQSNISNALGHIPNISDCVSNLLEATDKLDQMDAKLGDLESLIKETECIDKQIAKIKAAQKAKKKSKKKNCEPQGFQDKSGNQYDFFIDKDKNGTLSNETEFLGYEGGKKGQEEAWAEMTELDTSGDGFVDAKELEAGGVQVYKTDANGQQQAMSISEAFGEDADLKINTKQHDEAMEGIGPNNFNIGTGSENNELWGTFDVSLNGEDLTGYQTNDDLDWLKENYNFSDYSNNSSINTTESTTNNSQNTTSKDLSLHQNFFNTYEAEYQNLSAELDNAWKGVDVSEETMITFREMSKIETLSKANEENEIIKEEERTENEDTIKQDNLFLQEAARANNVEIEELTEEQIDNFFEEEYELAA